MAAAAAAEESLSVAVQVTSVPNSIGRSPEAEGVGTAGEEKDAATKGTVAVGDSEEDGEEDVFEVERILDMKCEGVCGGCATRTRPEGRGGDHGGGENPSGTPNSLEQAGRTVPVCKRRLLWPSALGIGLLLSVRKDWRKSRVVIVRSPHRCPNVF